MEEGDFPEFKDNKQFNVKLIKGKSVEKLLDETQERLTIKCYWTILMRMFYIRLCSY